MKFLTWLFAALVKKQPAAPASSSPLDAEFLDLPMRAARERTLLEQQRRTAPLPDRMSA